MKPTVRLANIALGATGPVVWRFTSGTAPYTTTFTVHVDQWERTLKKVVGRPLNLDITDSRGVRITIKQVYILHRVPSDSPYRVSFVVADRRWLWPYKLIARDFNMARKTGDRTAKFDHVPIETRQVFDKYDYLPYSLDDGRELWSARRALEVVLQTLEPRQRKSKGRSTFLDFEIKSLPIEGSTEAGSFALQNVTLRDQGDAALSRLLGFIPGADLFVDANGKILVYDATDLNVTTQYFKNLPGSTYDGEHAVWVERETIRPTSVVAHYQREVEVLFDYSDDYGGTRANPGRNTPFLENVIPTVDPETKISEYDPEKGEVVSKTVPPGTWVEVSVWLDAMEADNPAPVPWNFDTIRKHWYKGDLDAVLGAGGLDIDKVGSIAARVQALKQHFRQTFRINRRYMERTRELMAVRVALLDPVTGARAPATVWGQICITPSAKGIRMAARRDGSKSGVNRNVDHLEESSDPAKEIVDTAPGPGRVNILDRDLGIFRIEWLLSPIGDVASILPCHLVNSSGSPAVVLRDLAQQDTKPMGGGMVAEGATNGIFLRETLDMKVLMTIVPNAPNNPNQFHKIRVNPGDIAKLFRTEFRITKGKGPDLEVFVPPSEATARFGLQKETLAASTVEKLLALDSDDPKDAGIIGPNLPGYVLVNADRELASHSKALATELLAPFADNVQGVVSTAMPRNGKVGIVGNVGVAAVQVSAAPSGKVAAIHQFPGQQRPLSRFALMSSEARAIVLGIVPFKTEK